MVVPNTFLFKSEPRRKNRGRSNNVQWVLLRMASVMFYDQQDTLSACFTPWMMGKPFYLYYTASHTLLDV